MLYQQENLNSLDLDYEMDRVLGQEDLLPFCRATFKQSRTLHKIFRVPEDEGLLEPELKRYWDSMSNFKLSEGNEEPNTFQEPDHIRYLAHELDEWIRIPGSNLMVFSPPRHGKTELCMVRLVPFVMGRFPGAEVMGASYAQGLINSKSRQARTVCMTEAYREIFPDAWLNPAGNPFGYYAIGRGATEEWETPNGSIFKCAGIGAGLTGRGFHFGLIDDPVKGRAEAESSTIRDRDWDWYVTVFCTRAMPGARKLLIMTRWNQDDLAGRILKRMQDGGEQWKVINLKAIAEKNDPIGRRPGEALWDERYPIEKLEQIREIEGIYNWSALYGGEPVPAGGELIDRGKFKFAEYVPEGLQWARFWDFGVSDSPSANKTAGIGGAIDNEENLYLRHPIHGQWLWSQSKRVIYTSCKIEGPEVAVGGEDAGQQKAMINDLHTERRFRPYSIFGYPVPASKRVRALPWIAKLDAGKVYLVGHRGWNYFLDCCQKFTGLGDEEDDLIDAVSGVYQMLVGPGPKEKRRYKVHIGRF